jgi:hypothetical protein
MFGTVVAFDRQLRTGFDEQELAVTEDVLQRMQANVTTREAAPSGLVDLVLAPSEPAPAS